MNSSDVLEVELSIPVTSASFLTKFLAAIFTASSFVVSVIDS